MNNLITVLTTIDPTEVEGLLARFGLHPTVLAVVLYAIAVHQLLNPSFGSLSSIGCLAIKSKN